MSGLTLLRMPWFVLRRSTCWFWSILTVTFWVGAAACVHFVDRPWPGGWMGATMILALWLAYTGVLLGTLLLPAAEARRLRLPCVERAAPLSLGLNSVLVLALTATPLAFMSGYPAPVVELLLVALAAGLLYALLPALWLIVCIPLLQGLAVEFHWRFLYPLDPLFGYTCATFVALAACAGIWSWRRVLRSADNSLGWGLRPVAFIFHTRMYGGFFDGRGAGPDPTVLAMRQTPRWLERRGDLRDAGPSDLLRGVRVLLGGPYLPVTRLTALRRLSTGALFAALFAPVWLPIWTHDNLRWSEVRWLVAFAVIFGSAVAVLMGSLVRSTHLAQRWSRPAGELALLPLLPRLGTMPEQKSRLLRVVFTRMRAWHLPLILAPLSVEWANWHDPIRTVMLLAILGMAPVAEATYVYCMLGGRHIGQWAFWPLAVVGVVSFFVGLDITLGPGAVPIGWPVFAPLGACAFIYAVLSTLAVRGKQSLQRQPHPYLSAG